MTGPVALVILDGFGIAPPGPGNAVELADTPVFDALVARFPHTRMAASGRAVGLPEGQMGNSEVGHLNLGAGRVVRQDLVRIGDAIADGSFAANPAIAAAVARAKAGRGVLHLAGLVSDGGVHSHVKHVEELVRVAGATGIRTFVHAFSDGRDVSPRQAGTLLPELARRLQGSAATIATVCGRFYAMDRDHRSERTERARALLVDGVGARFASTEAAIAASYAAGVTDEFVEPAVIDPAGTIQPGDALFVFNFRPDRARQICHALLPAVSLLATMTRYDDLLPGPVAFEVDDLSDTLADVLAAAHVPQLHVAESEKYPHVTYFFNGGSEQHHDGEEWQLLPSRRDVATYDLAPEMSAAAIADRFAERFTDGFGFAIVNLANPDMVGHTGVIPAVVRGVEAADRALGSILATVDRLGGVALVTADHGNAEVMLHPDGSPHTAHTTSPVPLVITRAGVELAEGGKLADLAPTALALLGLEQPAAMTGHNLLR